MEIGGERMEEDFKDMDNYDERDKTSPILRSKVHAKIRTVSKASTSKRPVVMLPKKCNQVSSTTTCDKRQLTRRLLPNLRIPEKISTVTKVKAVKSAKVILRLVPPPKSADVKIPIQGSPPAKLPRTINTIAKISIDKPPKKNPHRRNKGLSNCIFCDKSYNMPYLLQDHIRSHLMERPYFCKLCDDTLASKSSLKVHVRLVHHKARVNPFKCKVCSEPFSTLTGLKNHMTSHSADRNFQCEHCEMRYYTKKDLTRHMNIHNGNRGYECDLCKKEFTRSDSLHKHMKNVHSITPIISKAKRN